jgi:hypothetical protein
MLVPYKEDAKKRVFGQLQGLLNIPEDFDEESGEINTILNGLHGFLCVLNEIYTIVSMWSSCQVSIL